MTDYWLLITGSAPWIKNGAPVVTDDRHYRTCQRSGSTRTRPDLPVHSHHVRRRGRFYGCEYYHREADSCHANHKAGIGIRQASAHTIRFLYSNLPY